MNKPKHYRLTVTLTDAPPVRIYTADWPTVVHLPDGLDRWIVIRRHADGRTLVSAVNRETEPVRRAGYLLPAGESPVHSIRMVGFLTGIPVALADQAIAALPPVSLEDDGCAQVRLSAEDWDAACHYIRDFNTDTADSIADEIQRQLREGLAR